MLVCLRVCMRGERTCERQREREEVEELYYMIDCTEMCPFQMCERCQ